MSVLSPLKMVLRKHVFFLHRWDCSLFYISQQMLNVVYLFHCKVFYEVTCEGIERYGFKVWRATTKELLCPLVVTLARQFKNNQGNKVFVCSQLHLSLKWLKYYNVKFMKLWTYPVLTLKNSSTIKTACGLIFKDAGVQAKCVK